jgi:hypothetical protein
MRKEGCRAGLLPWMSSFGVRPLSNKDASLYKGGSPWVGSSASEEQAAHTIKITITIYLNYYYYYLLLCYDDVAHMSCHGVVRWSAGSLATLLLLLLAFPFRCRSPQYTLLCMRGRKRSGLVLKPKVRGQVEKLVLALLVIVESGRPSNAYSLQGSL